MALADDLRLDVAKIFREQWQITDGQVVPDDPSKLPLDNRGISLDGVVLYADLTDSTKLVDEQKRETAAEVYKTYLHCAGKIIRSESGVITAYDGDRIMAVFIGAYKNGSAVRAAMKLEWARKNIVIPAFTKQYPSSAYVIKHTVGIAASKLLVARTGVRGANDLVWVGSSANHAAKLTTATEFPIWITKAVFDCLDVSMKQPGVWQSRNWAVLPQPSIYGTTFHIEF